MKLSKNNINNWEKVLVLARILLFLMLLDVALLIFFKQVLNYRSKILYGGCILFFVVLIWRIAALRVIIIEVSEQYLSIRSNHPFFF